MALVVTARAPAEASGRVSALHSRNLATLVVVGAAWYALALVVDSAARALPTTDWVEAAATLSGSAAALLVLGICLLTWFTRRADGGLLLAATLAAVLTALRLVSSALLITLDLSTVAEVTDTGLGLLALGAVCWSAAAWRMPSCTAMRERVTSRTELFRRVAEVTTFVLFAIGLSGAAVSAVGASWACRGVFPDCNGLGALPFGRDPSADVQLYHRLLSYVGLGLVAWLTVEAARSQRMLAGVPRAALVLLGATLLDAVVGGVSVSVGVPPVMEIAHTAATTLVCAAAAVLLVRASRAPAMTLASATLATASAPVA